MKRAASWTEAPYSRTRRSWFPPAADATVDELPLVHVYPVNSIGNQESRTMHPTCRLIRFPHDRDRSAWPFTRSPRSRIDRPALGFELVSRSFVEHQVVAPILFAVSAAGAAAAVLNRRRTAWICVGILCGFWIPSTGLIALLGTTLPSRVFWPALVACLGGLVLAYRRIRPDPPGLLTCGTAVGVALAGLFWFATGAACHHRASGAR